MDRILNVVPTGREGDEATATDFDFLLDRLRAGGEDLAVGFDFGGCRTLRF